MLKLTSGLFLVAMTAVFASWGGLMLARMGDDTEQGGVFFALLSGALLVVAGFFALCLALLLRPKRD